MIPYGRQALDEEEIKAVVEVLRSDWLTTGPQVEAFEASLADYCGARHAVVVSSCTAALHIAVRVSGLKPGDEGITTPNTFLSSANCIAFCNGIPRFSDILPDTYCLDPGEIEKAINPRTRVLIPVHFAGQPCDMASIHAIAQSHGLFLIEDAAHALGASWTDAEGKARKVGACTHSDITVFSFHPVKTITTGEGGAIMTNDDDLADRCRRLRNHGMTREACRFENLRPSKSKHDPPPFWYYEMHELGYNYRITDIQCALGLAQMERLDRFVARRRDIWQAYTEALEDVRGFKPPVEREGMQSAWHLYAAKADSRDALLRTLRSKGIGAHAMYIPLHMQPYYQKHFACRQGDFPRAEAYFEKAVILPLHPSLTDDQIDYIIQQVRRFYHDH